jgi:hypothetical protein
MYIGIALFFGCVALLTVFDIRAAVARSRTFPRPRNPCPRLNGDGRSGPVVLAGPATAHHDGGGAFDGGGFDGGGGE